ncbi:VPLPA-CTERM sorting domain-containing protein [uncultured Shimia sp.]|uniref:VPLPA-CTERM sorting domain-containing protein n=1 Tax=uncultured Shimia sp. TaxID=573152 RepID=UPI002636204B|nr:VPLPA-CTERM sorting domain-containing protein [uncultured Shimia sp.]
MKFGALVAIAAAGLLFAGGAGAATYIGITEGKRDLVSGTTALIGTDCSPIGCIGGTKLGFGAGEASVVDLHGRIVGDRDRYIFEATSSFTISFLFGGVQAIDTINDGQEDGTGAEYTLNPTGFIREGVDGEGLNNRSVFSLLGLLGNPLDLEHTMRTNVGGPNSNKLPNPGSPILFQGGPGSYAFTIDNRDSNPSYAARYDIQIAAVPVPAAGLLLLAGLGGLGFASRRRKT